MNYSQSPYPSEVPVVNSSVRRETVDESIEAFEKTRKSIMEERGGQYGQTVESNGSLAQGWHALIRSYSQKNGITSVFPAWFALVLQAFTKLNRIAFDPTNTDSWLDCMNYLELARRAYLEESKVNADVSKVD